MGFTAAVAEWASRDLNPELRPCKDRTLPVELPARTTITTAPLDSRPIVYQTPPCKGSALAN